MIVPCTPHCESKWTSSCYSADTHAFTAKSSQLISGGVAGYSTVLTDRKLEMDPFHQTFPGEVPVIIFAEEANVHKKRSPMAEQHVC